MTATAFDTRTKRGTTIVLLALAAMALAIFFSLPSCAGAQARKLAMEPAAIAFQHMEADILAGIEQDSKDHRFGDAESEILVRETEKAVGAALKAGDRDALRKLEWGVLMDYAGWSIGRRVQDGLIGPQVGQILLERVNQLRDLLQKEVAQ